MILTSSLSKTDVLKSVGDRRRTFYAVKFPMMHKEQQSSREWNRIPSEIRGRSRYVRRRFKRMKDETARIIGRSNIGDAEIRDFFFTFLAFTLCFCRESELARDIQADPSDRSITWIEYIRSAFAQHRDWSYVDRCRLPRRSHSANSTRGIEDSPFFSCIFPRILLRIFVTNMDFLLHGEFFFFFFKRSIRAKWLKKQ